MGIYIEVKNDINGIYDCDMLFIDSKFFKFWWKDASDDVHIFLMKRSCPVYWFDTADSTGTCNFQVLSNVERYYKSQVLKERRLYLQHHHRERIYFGYYFRKHGITDSVPTNCETLPHESELHKIYVSWNSSLNNYGLNYYSLRGKIAARLREPLSRCIFTKPNYKVKFTHVERKRVHDIDMRFGLGHNRAFVKYHREQALFQFPNVKQVGKVSYSKYIKDLRKSKVSISPFGLGEITLKDFDTIIAGACLIKPDMSHLETWPNLYQEDKTYVACNWDFSNLREKVFSLLDNPRLRYDIAREAQQRYIDLIDNGGIDFARRIKEEVGA